jgi:hypothetical protein
MRAKNAGWVVGEVCIKECVSKVDSVPLVEAMWMWVGRLQGVGCWKLPASPATGL